MKQLATGSVADVLLARASGLEGFARHVVIKRIRPELAREERFVAAFLEEARIAASLHHQNIVQVHDIGDEGGSIYFAMEYVHGEDCRKLLNRVRERKEVVPLQHVVAIVMATAAGLHYAHEQVKPTGESKGIIHRDVSPANILIGYDGSVKLVDFGLAKAAHHSTNATSSGTLRGKSSYMSPEQCTGKPLDRRTDTFSLGIVLFELLTAQRLFKGTNDFLTMAAIVDGEIPRPSSLRADVPGALDEIILRSLSRSPESRYQTAESLRESLEAFALAQELRTSHKALSDYLASLFGERPEPWMADQPKQPQWEAIEATHAGLVVMPRDAQSLLERYASATDSPLMQAQPGSAATDWADEDERESTSGQLPSLRRIGQPTEPTQTLRKGALAATANPNLRPRATEPASREPPAAVNPNVRPRASEPPATANPNLRPRANEPQPASNFDVITAVGEEEPDTRVGITDIPAAAKSTPSPTVPSDTTANAKPIEITRTGTTRPAKAKGDEPGSSTLVEPPIFDGGLRAEPDDDDDGLDDEPETEIALDAPEHIPDPPKEKMPLALRRPARIDHGNELTRAPDVVPAPLRPAARVQLPMGAQGQRETTPASSPIVPLPGAPAAQPPMQAGQPQMFAGVDPAAIAAGFQHQHQPQYQHQHQHQPMGYPPADLPYGADLGHQGAPLAEGERLSGFAASKRTLILVAASIAILIFTVVAMRACDNQSAPSAAPPDAEIESEHQDAAADDEADHPTGSATDRATGSGSPKSDAAGSATPSTTPGKKSGTKRTTPKRRGSR